ncbi:MAG: polysaccharide deacetylase family protein [Prevotella sp.]|nr:polysaccharide deacetylase family protein [Prevotella sp.]
MKKVYAFLLIVIIIVITVWWRAPIIGTEWSKQTLYVGLLDVWHGGSTDDRAHALWIDDDSTEGVFKVKKIADEVGIQPCFAVIADRMTPEVADSLAAWQQQGAGIVLHGYRHEKWWDWTEEQIKEDFTFSYLRLQEQGFDTTRIIKMAAPPHGCNNRIIRRVIQQQGLQMISGATLVNPDRHVFQLGRIPITVDTDTAAMRRLLQKAYERKGFVIFSTHSSIPSIFSEEKTRHILQMAKEMGFDFDFK